MKTRKDIISVVLPDAWKDPAVLQNSLEKNPAFYFRHWTRSRIGGYLLWCVLCYAIGQKLSFPSPGIYEVTELIFFIVLY